MKPEELDKLLAEYDDARDDYLGFLEEIKDNTTGKVDCAQKAAMLLTKECSEYQRVLKCSLEDIQRELESKLDILCKYVVENLDDVTEDMMNECKHRYDQYFKLDKILPSVEHYYTETFKTIFMVPIAKDTSFVLSRLSELLDEYSNIEKMDYADRLDLIQEYKKLYKGLDMTYLDKN